MDASPSLETVAAGSRTPAAVEEHPAPPPGEATPAVAPTEVTTPTDDPMEVDPAKEEDVTLPESKELVPAVPPTDTTDFLQCYW